MIKIKSPKEIELMRRAGKITAAARALAGEMVTPGVTTQEIDKAIHDFIISKGAIPTFLNYGGFPKSVCISVNEEVIHGIPGNRVIREGDIVSIDVGVTKNGFVGDCAATFVAGKTDDKALKLIEVTKQSFFESIKFAKPGNRISDISRAVQSYVESNGYSVVREYVGHGVGTELHEEPEVPNYVTKRAGPRLYPGMTIAIEPMVNMGRPEIYVLDNKWTVVTKDHSLSSHYENTVLITDDEPEILTWSEVM